MEDEYTRTAIPALGGNPVSNILRLICLVAATVGAPIVAAAQAVVFFTPTGQSAYSLTLYSSATLESCKVVKATGGNLYNYQVATTSAVTAANNGDYVFALDTATAPTSGTGIAVTIIDIGRVGPDGKYSFSSGIYPYSTVNGITVCLSSTGLDTLVSGLPKYTSDANGWFTVGYQ